MISELETPIDTSLELPQSSSATLSKKVAQLDASFDAVRQRLETPCLIEASAGTGKSFTLIVLYLRFLLGLESLEPPLLPEQMVLITFTVAAAEELRQRLFRALSHLIRALTLSDFLPCSEVAAILELISLELRQELRERARKAQLSLINAPITTLHGFCKLAIQQSIFQTKIVTFLSDIKRSDAQLKKRAFHWWNAQLQKADPLWQEALLESFPHAEGLIAQSGALVERKNLKILPFFDEEETLAQLQKREASLKALQSLFYAHSQDEWAIELKATPRLFPRRGIRDWRAWWNKMDVILAHSTALDWQALRTQLVRFQETHLIAEAQSARVNALCAQLTASNGLLFNPTDAFLTLFYAHCQNENRQRQQRHHVQSFQDLIDQLEQALEGEEGEAFAQELSTHYRVFMVDECQDVDGQQRRILEKITQAPASKSERSRLIFVGDPKQSIYAFRGADIFEYFKLSQSIPFKYQLTLNHRATVGMVQAIQALWSQNKAAFVLKHLLWTPALSKSTKTEKRLVQEGASLSALTFHLPKFEPGTVYSLQQSFYRQWIADICARELQGLLKNGKIITTQQDGSIMERRVAAEDIVVLVQNWIEAQSILKAFRRIGLRGFYGSDATPLFAHRGAKQLYTLLWALLDEPFGPKRAALLAERFTLQSRLQRAAPSICLQEREEFEGLCQSAFRRWKLEGLFSALLMLLSETYAKAGVYCLEKDAENLAALHQALEVVSEQDQKWGWSRAHKTLAWFEREMHQASQGVSQFFLKQERAFGAILIATIFKSKGLEYPIVWIPFASSVVRGDDGFFHDPNTLELLWSRDAEESIVNAQAREHFAEQMRLLYVATTRAALHLSIGAAPVCSRAQKKEASYAPLSSLGHLLQCDTASSAESFVKDVENLAHACTQIALKRHARERPTFTQGLDSPVQQAAPCRDDSQLSVSSYSTDHSWKITSYSQITARPSEARQFSEFEQRCEESLVALETTRLPLQAGNFELKGEVEVARVSTSALSQWHLDLDEGVQDACGLSQEFSLDQSYADRLLPHAIAQFPKGAQAGSSLHELLENWDFRSELCVDEIEQRLGYYEIEKKWAPWVQAWMQRVSHMRLLSDGFCLSDLKKSDYIAEMKFMLSVPHRVFSQAFEEKMPPIPQIGVEKPSLAFSPFHGGVQGFLDLLFCWQDRYYVLDYKSNALGLSCGHYAEAKLWSAMAEHRYDVQAMLYSLAIDRYLETLLDDYSYQKHFGGTIYLFLRGAAWPEKQTPSESALDFGVLSHRASHAELQKLKRLLG